VVDDKLTTNLLSVKVLEIDQHLAKYGQEYIGCMTALCRKSSIFPVLLGYC